MQNLVGVILAGGQAKRMGMDKTGGDKGLLKLAGVTLLERVIERLSPQVGGLVISANGDPSRFDVFGAPVVADSIEGFAGPLAGILAGLDWTAKQGGSHMVSAAADTPFFPDDLVQGLICAGAGQQTPIVLAATMDPIRGLMRHPTFGLWPVALRHDLRGALCDGVRKVVQWADEQGTTSAEFKVRGHDPFFNVNSFADMDAAELIVKAEKL